MNVDLTVGTLEELYAQIPAIDCRGKCANSCGPIDMSTVERQRIRDLGIEIPRWTPEAARRWANQEALTCPALGAFRQCRVYDVRPMICRLWGVTEGMPCVWGCRPERYLTDAEGFGLVAASMRIGGNPSMDPALLAQVRDTVVSAEFLDTAVQLVRDAKRDYDAITAQAHLEGR